MNMAAENYMKAFGRRLKKLREKQGLTQTELARKLGKSLRTVQKYESGEIDIPLSMLYSISEVFDVTISFLTNLQASETAKITVKLHENGRSYHTVRPNMRLDG